MSVGGVRMQVKFFTKPNCGLCEEGLQTLKMVQEEIAIQIDIINIEEHDAIHEKYMFMIPVVESNNQILQYGQLDYPTLYEALSD